MSPKRCAEISCFLCQSSFINNFIEKNNFSEPKNHRKLNILRPIYFKKISAHRFEDCICTNELDGLFFRKTFFSRTWSFFHDWKTTNLGVIFFHKKLILCFFQRWLFNFNILLKTCFRNLFRKTVSFFYDWKTINLGVTFFHKKLILYFFSKVII